MAGKEPMAFAKIATRGDVIEAFYITEEFVKERDASGDPIRIEVVLGRCPQLGGPEQMFDADFFIGNKMKISKRHAMIYWCPDKQHFELKSICKNGVRVNGKYVHIPAEKPRLTYEQLLVSVLEPDKQLTMGEIATEIQNRYPFYRTVDTNSDTPSSWKSSLRTTLGAKSRVFEKAVRTEPSGKKVSVWFLRRNFDPEPPPAAPAAVAAAAGGGGGAAHVSAGAAEMAATSGSHDMISHVIVLDQDSMDCDGGGGGRADGNRMDIDAAASRCNSVQIIEDSPGPAGGDGGGAGGGKGDGVWA